MKSTYFLSIVILLFVSSCEGQNSKKNDFVLSEKIQSVELRANAQKKCDHIIFYNPKDNLWKNFKIDYKQFKNINTQEHLYFIEDCSSVIVSPDKRVYMFREVLNDQIKFEYDYYEAPFVAFDTESQNYASYVGIVNNKLQELSISQGKADFSNQHDFLFEDNTYYLYEDVLTILPALVEKKEIELSVDDLKNLIENVPFTEKNIKEYNDIAFYLGKTSTEILPAIYLLEKLLEKFPQRVVAYLNLADCYWSSNNKEKARENYLKYIELMKYQNKDTSKIPERVYKRSK